MLKIILGEKENYVLTKNFSILKAIKFGFTEFFYNFKDYFKFSFATGLIYVGIIKILLLIIPLFFSDYLSKLSKASIVFKIILEYILPIITAAIFVLIKYIPIFILISFILEHQLLNKKLEFNFTDLTNKKRWQFVWIRIKYGLLVGIGFSLLVIPGIYWYLQYYFRGFTFIDKNINDAQDEQISQKISSGVRFKLMFFELIWAIPLELIGFIIAVPVFINPASIFTYPRPLTISIILFEFFYAVLYLPIWILASISIYKQLTVAGENKTHT